jgi:tight adherence protein B
VIAASLFARGAPLSGGRGDLLIAVVGLVAAGLVAGAFTSTILTFRKRPIDDLLTPYGIGAAPDVSRRSAGRQELVESRLGQRLVAVVTELASRRGLLELVAGKLDQAEVPIGPAEGLFLYALGVIVLGGAGLMFGNFLLGLLLLAVAAAVPWMVLGYLASRRTRAFTRQLPEFLQLLATTLRSGFSLLQGLDTISHQIADPMGEQMRKVVAETRLGLTVSTALSDLARRVRSVDFDWVVTAISIQREVGGNLAELLDIVAETMTARERLRREARTLSAEGRIGAVIISVLPVAIGLFIYAVNPSYIDPLFTSATGRIFFIASVVLALIGILWMRKIVHIEI